MACPPVPARSTTAIQDEPRKSDHPRRLRAQEDGALRAGGTRLEGCAIDDHRAWEHTRCDVPRTTAQHVLQGLVEVLRVEATADLPDAPGAQQPAHRRRGYGRREEDLALLIQRKTCFSGHRNSALEETGLIRPIDIRKTARNRPVVILAARYHELFCHSGLLRQRIRPTATSPPAYQRTKRVLRYRGATGRRP